MLKRTIPSGQRNSHRVVDRRHRVLAKSMSEPRRGLTAESFAQFLCWLAPERKQAGLKYEQIREKLVRFFTCRGCHIPEELFDRTIDRVSQKLATDVMRAGDPLPFCYGVAKNILLEYWREPRPGPMLDDALSPNHGPHWDEGELLCLERCLEQLSARDRSVIMRYYQGEGREKIRLRKEMALEAGGVNALRIQTFRIRAKLREKVSEWRRQQGRGE